MRKSWNIFRITALSVQEPNVSRVAGLWPQCLKPRRKDQQQVTCCAVPAADERNHSPRTAFLLAATYHCQKCWEICPRLLCMLGCWRENGQEIIKHQWIDLAVNGDIKDRACMITIFTSMLNVGECNKKLSYCRENVRCFGCKCFSEPKNICKTFLEVVTCEIKH